MNKWGRSHVGPYMRNLVTFLFLFLLGCTCETNPEGDEEMTQYREPRGAAKPENWGQEKVFTVGKLAKFPRSSVVLDLPAMKEWRVPRVQSLIAAVENADTDSNQEYFLRWVLRSGTGGARTQVVFDAVGFTRLSLPVEQVNLSLAYESYSDSNDSPAGVIKAHAYLGDFAIGELDPGPMYTAIARVAIAPNPGSPAVTVIPLPAGANRFRLIGNERSTVGPFRTTTYVSLKQGNTTVAGYVGARAALTSANSLHALSYTGDFIPIGAGVSRIEVENTDTVNGIFAFIQFGLDL